MDKMLDFKGRTQNGRNEPKTNTIDRFNAEFSPNYREQVNELSDHVAAGLNAMSVFSSCLQEDLLECDVFCVLTAETRL